MKNERQAGTAADSSITAQVTTSSQPCTKPHVIHCLFYADPSCRVYEMNGVKKNSPFHAGYFRPINITSENDKEWICEYGTVNKKSGMYSWRRTKFKTFTEQEMLDDIYVAENRHLLSERVRKANADVLRQIEGLLEQNGV